MAGLATKAGARQRPEDSSGVPATGVWPAGPHERGNAEGASSSVMMWALRPH